MQGRHGTEVSHAPLREMCLRQGTTLSEAVLHIILADRKSTL